MGKIITCKNGRKFERVSKWIKIEDTIITPRSSLYKYSDNGSLIFFRHYNHWYALGEFTSIKNADVSGFEFESREEKGKIIGISVTRNKDGIYCELDKSMERIRLYKNCL